MLAFARTVKKLCNGHPTDDVCSGDTMQRLHLPVLRSQPVWPAELPQDPLVDGFARRIRYLRVSVTDRCNYRCTYCMPETLEDRMAFQPRSALLTFEELEQ